MTDSREKRDKQRLKAELIAALTSTLASLKAAHDATTEGATHEEAKPENDKDTRALEQQYLARGQAMRIEALVHALNETQAMPIGPTQQVRVGAWVEAEDDDEQPARFFVAPAGGGTRLSDGSQVVTPASPLGQALLGKREGDEVELRIGPKSRHYSIVVVR